MARPRADRDTTLGARALPRKEIMSQETCTRAFPRRRWATSGAGEDDELLSRPGHRDIAVDRSFDARAERLRVDEDDKVELEPFRQFRGQRLDAGCRPERGIADDARDPSGMRGEPAVEDRAKIRRRSVHDGEVAAADGCRYVGVRE